MSDAEGRVVTRGFARANPPGGAGAEEAPVQGAGQAGGAAAVQPAQAAAVEETKQEAEETKVDEERDELKERFANRTNQEEEVFTLLRSIGIDERPAWNLIYVQGFVSVSELADVTDEDKQVSDMVKRMSHGDKFVIGARQEDKLKSVVFWARDMVARGHMPRQAEFELDDLQWATERRAAIKRAREEKIPEKMHPGKLQTDKNWVVWKEKMQNYLDAHVASVGYPLSYVIQPRDGQEFESEEEEYMSELRLTGALYTQDNNQVFRILKSCLIETTVWGSVKRFEKKKDGRGLWEALVLAYDGVGAVNKRVMDARERIDQLYYRSEGAMPFQTYVNNLAGAFEELDRNGFKKTEGDKVQILVSQIKTDHSNLPHAVSTVHHQYHDSFHAAANYLSTELTRPDPKNPGRKNLNRQSDKRKISEANTRGGGRGRARRGGRGGRGEGRGGGQRGGYSDNGAKVIINGVDCTDPTKSYSNEEWNKLGCMKKAIAERRSRVAGRGDARNVSAVNTQQQEEEATSEADGGASGEKGGQNGANFGPGRHRKKE